MCMEKRYYFGGQFNFRYKDYSIENIAKDYRSKILGDYNLWLNTPSGGMVKINDKNYYVGPFYFTEHKDGDHIVNFESHCVNLATDCFFVLSNASAPGTITEIIQASLKWKNIHIFYVKKDIPTEEIDTEYKNDLWYPITFAMSNAKSVEVYGFDTYDEAVETCVNRFNEMTK